MERTLAVLCVYNQAGKKTYYVVDSYEGSAYVIHVGPYSTEDEAWEWIREIKP